MEEEDHLSLLVSSLLLTNLILIDSRKMHQSYELSVLCWLLLGWGKVQGRVQGPEGRYVAVGEYAGC